MSNIKKVYDICVNIGIQSSCTFPNPPDITMARRIVKSKLNNISKISDECKEWLEYIEEYNEKERLIFFNRKGKS